MARPRWKNPDKRMARAVELRRQGLSLRQIGTELAVDEKTVRNDLARWATTRDGLPLGRPQLKVLRNPSAESELNSAPQIRTDSAVEEAG